MKRAPTVGFVLCGLGIACGTAFLGHMAFLEVPPASGEAAEAYWLSQPPILGAFWLFVVLLVSWSAWGAAQRLERGRAEPSGR